MAERYRTGDDRHWRPIGMDGACDGYRRPIKKSRYKTIYHTRRALPALPPLPTIVISILPFHGGGSSYDYHLLLLSLDAFSRVFVVETAPHPMLGASFPLQRRFRRRRRRRGENNGKNFGPRRRAHLFLFLRGSAADR